MQPPQSFISGVALVAGVLIFVSAIETPFVKRMCGVAWKRAILASLIVNAVTTFLGAIALPLW